MDVLLYNSFDIQGHLFRVDLLANLLYYEKTLYVIYFLKTCKVVLNSVNKIFGYVDESNLKNLDLYIVIEVNFEYVR